MGYKQQRPTIKVGKTSKALILAKPWLDYHGEKAKLLTPLGDAILIIAPQGYEKKAPELSEAMDEVTLLSSRHTTRSGTAPLLGQASCFQPMSGNQRETAQGLSFSTSVYLPVPCGVPL